MDRSICCCCCCFGSCCCSYCSECATVCWFCLGAKNTGPKIKIMLSNESTEIHKTWLGLNINGNEPGQVRSGALFAKSMHSDVILLVNNKSCIYSTFAIRFELDRLWSWASANWLTGPIKASSICSRCCSCYRDNSSSSCWKKEA